jgi:hypothetical protein
LIDTGSLPVESGARSAQPHSILLTSSKGSKTMTSKTVLIAAAALIAAPAAAKGSDEGSKAGRTTASEQKYCLEYEKVTGSRVSKQECRTKKEWRAEGVNIDKMLKN